MGEPAFVMQQKVLFQHCDPAGIVFYPRYFEMINATVEAWFDDGLGMSFARMMGELHTGVPLARIEAEFHAPSRLGDMLDLSLELRRLGRASCDVTVRASAGHEERLTANATLVHVDARLKAAPWPDELRARIGGGS